MKSYSKTDVGIKRTMNQDSLFCSDSPVGSFRNLFIVADGMGGHKAGDRASRLCIENMVAQVRESASKTPVTIFEEAITYANRAVYESAKEDIEFEGYQPLQYPPFPTREYFHTSPPTVANTEYNSG